MKYYLTIIEAINRGIKSLEDSVTPTTSTWAILQIQDTIKELNEHLDWLAKAQAIFTAPKYGSNKEFIEHRI